MFVEGELAKTNTAFPIFAPIAQTMEYAPLPPGRASELDLKSTAKAKKLKLTDAARAARWRTSSGGDLWALDNELEKLAAYAGGEIVDEQMVAELVSAARETKMWDLTDAVVAGNERKALTSLGRLLIDGEAPQLLLFMIARQYRQLVMVKDLRERRVAREEMQRRLGRARRSG